jgi:hypothetical protein
VASAAAAALATLARIDGVLLLAAPGTAWLIRRGWAPWRAEGQPTAFAWALAAGVAYVAVLSPWLLRNVAAFGSPLPSAGGHTVWITSYNEQFSIGHEVTLDRYLAWGLPNIIGSKLEAWGELLGRTGVLLGGIFFFFLLAGLWIHRRRTQLGPFLAYLATMFVVMGAVFTFHAPKGAFYHSAPAWLPFAFSLAVASVGRVWPFLRRRQAQRFVAVAGLAGAVVLSLVGSGLLYAQWSVWRSRDEAAGRFFVERGLTEDRVMHSDPVSLHDVSGNPAVAAPFDPYPILERVARAYDVRWVVVTLGDGAEIDPLGLWLGAEAIDADGNRATWLAAEPAFEADGVRIYQVLPVPSGPLGTVDR